MSCTWGAVRGREGEAVGAGGGQKVGVDGKKWRTSKGFSSSSSSSALSEECASKISKIKTPLRFITTLIQLRDCH